MSLGPLGQSLLRHPKTNAPLGSFEALRPDILFPTTAAPALASRSWLDLRSLENWLHVVAVVVVDGKVDYCSRC